jgi:hypothetical protein
MKRADSFNWRMLTFFVNIQKILAYYLSEARAAITE